MKDEEKGKEGIVIIAIVTVIAGKILIVLPNQSEHILILTQSRTIILGILIEVIAGNDTMNDTQYYQQVFLLLRRIQMQFFMVIFFESFGGLDQHSHLAPYMILMSRR